MKNKFKSVPSKLKLGLMSTIFSLQAQLAVIKMRNQSQIILLKNYLEESFS